MLIQCTLPAAFTTWEDSFELEEEEFTRFREQGSSEAIIAFEPIASRQAYG